MPSKSKVLKLIWAGDVRPLHAIWATFFTLESVKINLGSGLSSKCVLCICICLRERPSNRFIFFSQSFQKKSSCRTLIVPGQLRQTLVQRPSGRKSLTFKLNRRSPLVYSLNHQLKNSQTFIKNQIFHI